MGCAASSDTGTEYVSLGHHGNRHVSKKPRTPTDEQLYGKNHNQKRKSSTSSSSSSSSSDSCRSDKKKKDKEVTQQNGIQPAPVVLEQKQQEPLPNVQEQRRNVLPPLVIEKKKDPEPNPPVTQVTKEKNDPEPNPPDTQVTEEKNDPEPNPPIVQERKDPSPPPVFTEANDSREPTPDIQLVPIRRTAPDDNEEENKEEKNIQTPENEHEENKQPPPPPQAEEKVQKDEQIQPVPPPPPQEERQPTPPPPEEESQPPPEPQLEEEEQPEPPAPQKEEQRQPTPPQPPPQQQKLIMGGTDLIDFTNTDGMRSPEPPDFTISDYTPTDIGTHEKSIDCRTTYDDWHEPSRPSPNDNGLYTDHSFTPEVAVPNAHVDWQRPMEICPNPALFTDGTTRFDIGQGRFGTCWFLSMVANIADKPRLLRRVIPKSGYKIGTPEYDGVFHCRFWRFGRWSNVYIDDFLPTANGRPYGASNNSDPNEMWVALLEKAFAKMYGSYEEVTGGRTADAFMNLTAGVGETIKFDKMKRSPADLFKRLTRAFQSPTTMVGCVCPAANDGKHGLVGGHAYSMNGTVMHGNTMLLRIRNPWGRQEWSGPWSDGSPEMSEARSAIPHPNKDDGEFYMDIDNFLTYFEQCTICNITPDFDRDGRGDTLHYITNIYGNWRPGKSGGFQNKLQNPMYCVTVDDSATQEADENGKVPFVVQIIQRTADRQDDKVGIRVDLYKVLYEDSNMVILDELGDKNNLYLIDFSASYRFAVTPGKYVAIPSTMNSGQQDPKVMKEFLIRFFSAGPLSNPFEVQDSTKVIAGKGPELDAVAVELTQTQCHPGRFRSGHNAGGQISCRDTFASNPQFLLTVIEPQTIKCEIMQPDPDDPNKKMPLGIKLFRASRENFPADYDFLVNNYGDAVKDVKGDDGPFSYGNSVDCGYNLQPGTYLLIIHSNSPDDENDFALAIYSEKSLSVECKNM